MIQGTLAILNRHRSAITVATALCYTALTLSYTVHRYWSTDESKCTALQSYAYALFTSPHARRMLVGFLSCFCRIPFLPAAARLSTHAAGSPYFLVSSSLAVLSHSP